MRILFIALEHEYGEPKRGPSFEYMTFYTSLRQLDGGGHDVRLFAMDSVAAQRGIDGMNEELLRTVGSYRPDVCFFFLFTDEISIRTLQTLRKEGWYTINWFADDQWRWFNFSRRYAPYFSAVVTTDVQAYARYRERGLNAVLSQWAAAHCAPRALVEESARVNNEHYAKAVFVGQAYGARRSTIDRLRSDGIAVDCYGSGWSSGRITDTRMHEVFRTSTVALNFAAASATWSWRSLGRMFVHKQHGSWTLVRPWEVFATARAEYARLTRPQIKGRVFEVVGDGGCLLTEYVPGLEKFFDLHNEIVVFTSYQELKQQLTRLLAQPEEARRIALRGYDRVVREHTYEHRFRNIFTQLHVPGYGSV